MAAMVKVAQLGQAVKEVYVEGTVGDALSAAGVTVPPGHGVRVSGRTAELSSAIKDGDIITLVPSVKGGA